MMLEIDGWKVGMKFSAAHFIPEHGKCSRIHGHDYGVRLRIYGEEEGGILYDFIDLKRKVREICDELDHHILVPTANKDVCVEESEDMVNVSFGSKNYSFPSVDVVFVDILVPSAELLAQYIGRRLVKSLNFPANVKGVEVCVDEGPGQGACEYISMEVNQ